MRIHETMFASTIFFREVSKVGHSNGEIYPIWKISNIGICRLKISHYL